MNNSQAISTTDSRKNIKMHSIYSQTHPCPYQMHSNPSKAKIAGLKRSTSQKERLLGKIQESALNCITDRMRQSQKRGQSQSIEHLNSVYHSISNHIRTQKKSDKENMDWKWKQMMQLLEKNQKSIIRLEQKFQINEKCNHQILKLLRQCGYHEEQIQKRLQAQLQEAQTKLEKVTAQRKQNQLVLQKYCQTQIKQVQAKIRAANNQKNAQMERKITELYNLVSEKIDNQQQIKHRDWRESETSLARCSSKQICSRPITLQCWEQLKVSKDKHELQKAAFNYEKLYIDEDGYLLDSNQCYLLNEQNHMIQLSAKRLKLLAEYGVLH